MDAVPESSEMCHLYALACRYWTRDHLSNILGEAMSGPIEGSMSLERDIVELPHRKRLTGLVIWLHVRVMSPGNVSSRLASSTSSGSESASTSRHDD